MPCPGRGACGKTLRTAGAHGKRARPSPFLTRTPASRRRLRTLCHARLVQAHGSPGRPAVPSGSFDDASKEASNAGGASNGAGAGDGLQQGAAFRHQKDDAGRGGREKAELERVLLLIKKHLAIAADSVKTCKSLCNSVPVGSLQMSTLLEFGELVLVLEDMSAAVSHEAAGAKQLVETLRETAESVVLRASAPGPPRTSHDGEIREARVATHERPEPRNASFRSPTSRTRSLRFVQNESSINVNSA